jgi:penicillin G amidase
VLIMKYMAATLSGYEDDYNVSALMLALGESKFNKLFPDFLLPLSPVTPDSSGPVNEALVHSPKPAYLDYSFLTAGSFVPESSFNPHLGSNSWAVSGSKTKSGKPILCNDPHLNLTLPAIWIEMQLSCPGINVYGVSIPGTPSVIIGFNENIAWGLTNGANDVKDYYKLRLKGNYEQYELDGRWHNLPFRIDTIRKRGVTPLYDTIYYTVHGPVVFDKSFPGRTGVLKDMAMKWELHRPSNEFFTFIQLSKAQNYNEYREAISHYGCPVQNFTFACKDNTIAVDHQGNLPIKPAGAGRFILDGTQSSYLYNRYIPQDSLPHVVNPAGQFVFSANQHPTSQHYPYYYNGYFSEERANRIRSLLESNDSFDLAAMKRMQLDNTSAFAMDVLQVLIPIIQPINLTADQQGLLPALAAWKGNYDADNEQAKLFELWWQYIKEYTWDEFRLFSFGSKIPADYVLIDLIRSEPGNEYFDQLGTGAKETARDIVYAAFTRACAELSKLKKKGSIRWGDLNKVSITHLTRQSAFSITDLVSAGHPQAINAVSASWGPGWRMIVELGDRPRAIGIYAGGQSGNIGSRHYDEFITDWNKGNYYQLQFFMSEQEAKAGARKLTAIK